MRVIPGAFELKGGHKYPDMKTLCNGFKTLHTNEVARKMRV